MDEVVDDARVWIKQDGQMRDYVAAEEFPGPRVQTDEDWLAFCREARDTVFHPTSTCRMGTDALAVVEGCAWSTPRSCPRCRPETSTLP